MGSRTKKAFDNSSSALLLEIITAICGLILPRLILSHFGSSYNGITTSISQFISCIALLKSGIGSVTRAALYGPLSRNDSIEISKVVNASKRFLNKIAYIFLGSVLIFAAIYPFLVSDDFSWLFAFTLVLILSISTFAQYYFGLAYQMVLEADQRNYIVNVVTIVSTIINTLIASLMIITGFGIHAVKLGSAIVFTLPPIFYAIYVKKRYNINTKIEADDKLISQRWDAFAHQLANFVNDNTDVMVITIFLGVMEVSVYSIYNMVALMIKKVVLTISNGATSAFGNMIANKEDSVLATRFRQYELLVFAISAMLLSITSVMYLPFISLYTSGVNDVNYLRPIFANLVCLATFFACVKTPYQQMVYAAGMFKQTRNKTILEAIINIVVSLGCVQFLGISGVIIGTICASAYRAIQYSFFVNREIIKSKRNGFFIKLIYAALIYITVFGVHKVLPFSEINYFYEWILWAVVYSLVSLTVMIVYSLIFYRKDSIALFRMLLGIFRKSR